MFLEIPMMFPLELLFFRLNNPDYKSQKLSKSLLILETHCTSYFSPHLPRNIVPRSRQSLQ